MGIKVESSSLVLALNPEINFKNTYLVMNVMYVYKDSEPP